MVSKTEIIKILHKYFSFHDVKVLPNGQVEAYGDISLLNRFDNEVTTLPVSFKLVKESLSLEDNLLVSLKGCPVDVGMTFDCSRNNLESLEYGPQTVGWNYYCNHNQLGNLKGAPALIPNNFNCMGNPLKSLEGFPTKIGNATWITYSEKLPLLRTLAATFVFLELGDSQDPEYGNKLNQVQKILAQYQGKGKRAMFDCQKALEDAGFEENARW